MLIRDVTPDDLERLAEINAENVPEVGPADEERLAFILGETSIGLVVEIEDAPNPAEIAGFCLVLSPGTAYDSVNYAWFMERYPDAMYLDRVAFDHRFQGRGLGRALYAAVDDRMRRDHPDVTALALEVNVDPPNEPSLRFHARQGFTEVGRLASKGIEASMQIRTR